VFERYYSVRLRDMQNGAQVGEAPAALERGLGLAIAKRVCDMQGWSLTVQSRTEEPGRGTGFMLRFADGEKSI
jgi:signal transduction histidine kinase